MAERWAKEGARILHLYGWLAPGAVAPGVVGTICVLLGLYALNLLPINYAGLGLMMVGIALLTIEAKSDQCDGRAASR